MRVMMLVAAVIIAGGCHHSDGAVGDDLAGAASDLAIVDAAMRDLATRDLATRDLTIGDLAPSDDLAIADLAVPDDLATPDDLVPPIDLVATIDLAGCTVCGSACVEVLTDPNNCGGCDHVCGCGSTTCTNGVCDPQKLVDHTKGTYAIYLANGIVYFAADGTMDVSSVAATGGEATQLFINVPVIRGMTGNATSLFFTRTNFNVLESGPIGGGSVHNASASPEPSPFGLVSDGTTLFWPDLGAGNLRALTIGSTTATTIESAQAGTQGVAVDDNYVYWTTSTSVLRAAKTGGVITTVVDAESHPVAVAVDGTNAYWVNDGDGHVSMRAKDGTGDVTPIAVGQMSPINLVVDGTTIFWTEYNGGNVWSAPIAGGTPRTIAVGLLHPSSLTLDADCVYFTEFGSGTMKDGSINRSPKN